MNQFDSLFPIGKSDVPANASDLSSWTNCPVCRHGSLTSMALMETTYCSFCHHIFSIDGSALKLKLEDSIQPHEWVWNGNRWEIVIHQHAVAYRPWLWSLAILMVLLPTSLVFVSGQLFPASPHSRGFSIAVAWPFLTLLSHIALASWLLSEHYQWPLYTRLKVMLETFISRPSNSALS